MKMLEVLLKKRKERMKIRPFYIHPPESMNRELRELVYLEQARRSLVRDLGVLTLVFLLISLSGSILFLFFQNTFFLVPAGFGVSGTVLFLAALIYYKRMMIRYQGGVVTPGGVYDEFPDKR